MDNSDNTVKGRLKAYLSANNITMAEFGRRIGVSSAYITSKPPQVKAIERLLRILPPPAEAKEPDTVSRLLAIIESQQRVIESLTRVHNI